MAAMAVDKPSQKVIDVDLLTKASEHVEHLLESPDWVLDSSTADAQSAIKEARKLVKLFFDAAHARCPPNVKQISDLGPRGLVVKGFNPEQIWEELEVQNIPLRRHLRARIAKVVKGKVSLKTSAGGDDEAGEQAQRSSAPGADEAAEGEVKKKKKKDKKKQEAEDEAEDENVPDIEAKSEKKKKGKDQTGTDDEPAAGDDDPLDKDGVPDPFSFEAMEKFADEAEKNMRIDPDAEDSDFGLLEAGSEDEDEEAKNMRFDDYFRMEDEEMPAKKKKEGKKGRPPPSDEDDNEEDEEEKPSKKTKQGKKGRPPPSEEEDDDEQDDADDAEDAEEEEESEDGSGDDEAMIDPDAEGDDLSDEEKELEEKLSKLQAGGGLSGDEDEEDGDDEGEESEGGADAGDGEAKLGKGKRSLYDMDKSLRTLEDEVSKLEEEQMEEKPWMLKGEVSAKQRPLNSLLETHLEKPMSFFAGRRAEAAMEAAGGGSEDEAALEDVRGAADLAPRKKLDVEAIVRQRIWDEAFDDVIRKSQLPPSQRKRKEDEDVVETLNFEKSRVGLGDIYAKQYEAELLGHKTDEQEKDDKDKAEAKALFAKLMFKLDQLTNAHFTPRPVMMGASGDAVSKVPALKMEETIPLMVSDAHLKAPEQLKAPRRHEREQAELSHDERTAKRRQKKAARKKELHDKVEKGEMTLAGLRERAEVLGAKNKEAKLEKERQGKPKEARKKLKGSDLMAQAQAADTSRASRKEEIRKEREQRPEGALPSKRLKL